MFGGFLTNVKKQNGGTKKESKDIELIDNKVKNQNDIIQRAKNMKKSSGFADLPPSGAKMVNKKNQAPNTIYN